MVELFIFCYFRDGFRRFTDRKRLGMCMLVYALGTSLVAQVAKNLPAVQETQVRSLGREDPLKKRMATHSSTLARRIPRTEEPGRL